LDRSRREVIEEDRGTVADARSDENATIIGAHFLTPPDCETTPVPIEKMDAT
jgi:hypothetical protein